MIRRALSYLAAAILLIIVVYTGLRVFLRHQVDGHLQSIASASPALAAIGYTRLDVHLAPLGLALRDVTLIPSGHNDTITIRRAVLSDYQPGRPLPHSLALALENVRIAAIHPSIAPLRAALLELGLTRLDLDCDLRLEKKPAQTHAWQGHVELRAERAGILRLMLEVDNLNIEGVLQALDNPHHWWAVLPPVGIRSVAVEFEDQGLVERVVNASARRNGWSPAAARHRLRQTVEAAARREKLSPLGLMLSEFIAAPVRIGYYNGNPEPVHLGRLLWSRRFSDWCQALQIAGYRPATPRKHPWAAATGSIPGKPPQL